MRLETRQLSIRYTIFKYILQWIVKVREMSEERYPKLCLQKLIEIAQLCPNYENNWVIQIIFFFSAANHEADWLELNTSAFDTDAILSDYASSLHVEDLTAREIYHPVSTYVLTCHLPYCKIQLHT